MNNNPKSTRSLSQKNTGKKSKKKPQKYNFITKKLHRTFREDSPEPSKRLFYNLFLRRKRLDHKIALVTMLILLLITPILIVRLFWLQITHHDEFEEVVIRNTISDQKIEPARGDIYDANMELLAKSADVWDLYINTNAYYIQENNKPTDELDERKIECLGGILEELFDYSTEKLRDVCVSKKGQTYRIITKIEYNKRTELNERIKNIAQTTKVTDKNGRETSLSLPVSYQINHKRYYPKNNSASSVIGFVNDNGDGVCGIEAMYNSSLAGVPGKLMVARNRSQEALNYIYERIEEEKPGNSLVLTINMSIQAKLEKHLEQAVADFNVKDKAAGIVMNVNTGEILAMATIPDFDLNNPWTIADEGKKAEIDAMPATTKEEKNAKAEKKSEYQQKQWINKAISAAYNPGSVFKPVTCSMALEENLVSLGSSFYCPGYIKIGSTTIRCHKHSGHGAETLVDGMKNSCNPVFIGLGLKVGVQNFCKYLSAFGLTQKTGIDLPGENVGISYSADEMSQVDLGASAFGQSLTVTPIQMITAISAVANGGYLVQPHVVSRIIDSDGNIVESKSPQVKRQVISENTSKTVREMMEKVVSEGTGKNAYLEGYRIAGKTGTSENLERKRKTGEMTYLASFCGFAPADDPQIAVLVVFDNPAGDQHMGGQLAAPTVKAIMSDILPLVGVNPEYSQDDLVYKTIAAPNVLNAKKDDAIQTIRSKGLKERVIGNGDTVKKQIPEYGNSIPSGGTVIIYTDDTATKETVVPKFIGLTPAEVNVKATNAGLNVAFSGKDYNSSGVIANAQSIQEGTTVPQGTVVTVSFVHTENIE